MRVYKLTGGGVPTQPVSKGEDAHFATPRALGIADGVGGWACLGIDAGLYSRELMVNCEQIAATYPAEKEFPTPKELLQRAYDAIPSTIVGTTTATICTLEPGLLKVANLGDSGILVLRFSPISWSWQSHFRSQEQTHYFNCPLQLGTDSGDFPKDSDEYEVSVEEHDVVVLCTDGVFDNLFDDDIAALLMPHIDLVADRFDTMGAANAISQAALKASMNVTIQTPFSRGAKENLVMHSGGKQDDISVVVSVIKVLPGSHVPSFDKNPVDFSLMQLDMQVLPLTPVQMPLRRSWGGI